MRNTELAGFLKRLKSNTEHLKQFGQETEASQEPAEANKSQIQDIQNTVARFRNNLSVEGRNTKCFFDFEDLDI